MYISYPVVVICVYCSILITFSCNITDTLFGGAILSLITSSSFSKFKHFPILTVFCDLFITFLHLIMFLNYFLFQRKGMAKSYLYGH
ncbi:hypothetical protein Ahy_B06g082747 isoform D [Arachis hypogaea]|uniref:Uncharacterized protein n=1 Tax=Arachis hypogaea TaxID=3818 RepID=A0A444YNV0_ARAHY|nr:hypothetical protein Ahy_B06g082747 isoform D [Arachis hypogaea]